MAKKVITDKVTGEKRVILTGSDLTRLRMKKFADAGGMCECGCGKRAPWPHSTPMPWEGQLAHWPPKRMGNGFGSDTPETTKWLLGYCHDKLDNRHQKVVPKKVRNG